MLTNWARGSSPVSHKFFRVGDVTAGRVPKQSVVDDDGSAVEDTIVDSQYLAAFGDAVRGKEGWYTKILEQRNLAAKWVEEAQLPDDPLVHGLIRDLKSEARCIHMLDHTIRLISSSLPDRPIDWEAIQADVNNSDNYLRFSKFGISAPRLYEDVGAYFADDVVPKALHQELFHELGALAAMEPRDFHPGSGGKVQDLIHPSLYPYMVDSTPLPDTVIQPPTQDGKFITTMEQKHEYQDEDVTMESAYAWIPSIFTVSEDGNDVSIEGYINGLGTREQYPVLFRVIEQVFKIAMPLLERSVWFDTAEIMKDVAMPQGRFKERRDFLEGDGTIGEWKSIKERHRKDKAQEEEQAELAERQRLLDRADERSQYHNVHLPSDVPHPPRWAGQKLKVVVKAANYVLEPGQEYGGTWHIEGMPHERILASAIYYYERDDTIVDAGLYLRRKRDGDNDWPSHENANRDIFGGTVNRNEKQEEGYRSDDDRKFEHYHYGDDNFYHLSNAPSDYGSEAHMGDLPAYLNIGVLPTTNEHGENGTGRIVTFPNWVQHRVVSVYNDPSASTTAVRKILCFFLVDDSDDEDDELDYPGFSYQGMKGMAVLTTSDVPQQARACNLPTLAFLLPVACRQVTHGQRTLPPELVQIILSHVRENVNMEFGMSREDAERRRRALMSDRKVQTQDINGLWELEYSLCEH